MATLSLPLPWRVSADRPTAAAPERDEADWVEAAQGGDPDAFRLLVDRYGGLAFETALRIVRDPSEAEEVAQDGFLRAWKALPEFRGESRFSTWLYRIVTRCALDAAQRRKRRDDRETAREPEWIAANAPAASGAGPDRADLKRLERILANLEPVPRAAVTLYYLRERTIAEIASILDVPEGTVKTHLHRSRAALRKAWNRERLRERDRGLPEL